MVPRQTNTRHAVSLHRVCVVSRQPTLDTLSASTGYVWYRDSQHSTRSASTGYVWFRDSQHSKRSQHPQGMCGAETDQHSTRSQHPQGMCGSETANTRNALSLHRVCVVPRQPTLETLSASTGYVWFRDSQHSIRAQPPQGMCGSETANTRHAFNLHRVCVVPRQPTLDTRSASTGYVWFRDSQHSTRSASTGYVRYRDSQHSTPSQPPQGMCGSETDQHSTRCQPPQGMCGIETANTRHPLSLHRVCVVSRQPTLDTLSLHRVCEVPRPPQISTRSEHPQGMCGAETDQHSTRSQHPQGMCGSETANTRNALSLHRVCVVPRQPTLETLSASTGYVWFRDSQHSTRFQPPQGMCGSETANTRHAQPPQGM